MRSGSYSRQRSLISFRTLFTLPVYALLCHYAWYLGMLALSGTGGSCLTFERQPRLREHQSPLRSAGGGFFISGIKIFNCMCMDLTRTKEMSMNRIAVIAASGAFFERVGDAVRARTAAAREAREP